MNSYALIYISDPFCFHVFKTFFELFELNKIAHWQTSILNNKGLRTISNNECCLLHVFYEEGSRQSSHIYGTCLGSFCFDFFSQSLNTENQNQNPDFKVRILLRWYESLSLCSVCAASALCGRPALT